VVLGEDGVELRELPLPKLGPGDVLVRMMACGLCGTDIEKIRGRYRVRTPIGHEPAGIVEDVGDGVEDVRRGDRVFTHHHVPCYQCHYCRKGSTTMCPHYRESNLDPGGFAEYYRVPSWNVSRGGIIKVPSHVSFEEAALVEPLGCVMRNLDRRCTVSEDDDVLIVGAGPMGLLHLLVLKSRGVGRLLISDVSEYRLSFGEDLGADEAYNPRRDNVPSLVRERTGGRGVDVAIVATGHPEGILQAIESVRRGGKVCIFGVPHRGTVINYDWSEYMNNELSIITSNAADDNDTRRAMELIASGKVPVRRLITHRFRLGEFMEAVKVAEEGNAIKVIITP